MRDKNCRSESKRENIERCFSERRFPTIIEHLMDHAVLISGMLICLMTYCPEAKLIGQQQLYSKLLM